MLSFSTTASLFLLSTAAEAAKTSTLDAILTSEGIKIHAAAGQVQVNNVFSANGAVDCRENALVASWCNQPVTQCALWPDSNEYACSCVGNSKACPSECIDNADSKLIVQSHYGIRCQGIPVDSPNYDIVVPEHEQHDHCESNAIVASWCDSSIDTQLSCHLNLHSPDTYTCRCPSKSCPIDCVHGNEPLVKNAHEITCQGIPQDVSPNYILKQQA